MYNEILVAFLDAATENEDALYDAEKLRGNSDLAFYSKIGNREMVIQGLPALTSDRVVELGLHSTFAETHTIRLKDLENIPSTVMVYLIDKALNVTVNVSVPHCKTTRPSPAAPELLIPPPRPMPVMY
jgi:hypothetical protein